MIAKTPLYAQHRSQQARMVDFHGWEMPIHYGSQIEEHHSVRHHAGMFDVSHMTVLDLLGAGCRQFLRKLLTNDIDQLVHAGKALYSCMCNEHGGIIDDLIVYQRSPDSYRLILNSAVKEKDLAWIHAKSEGFAVGLQVRRDLSILAVQGPQAIAKTLSILTAAQNDAVSTLTAFEFVEINQWFFARTGYTGEDGLEMIVPNSEIEALWNALLNAGVAPCGLGARDTLRLEAGLLLYGQDMHEGTTPLESNLAWTIRWEPQERDFIGMGALISQKQKGNYRRLIGLILEDKGVLRTGCKVFADNVEIGQITSGTYSPTLNKSIALARISGEVPAAVQVQVREKMLTAKTGKPRFIQKGQVLWK